MQACRITRISSGKEWREEVKRGRRFFWHACVRKCAFAAHLRSHYLTKLPTVDHPHRIAVLAAIIIIPQSTISMEVIYQVPIDIQILALRLYCMTHQTKASCVGHSVKIIPPN